MTVKDLANHGRKRKQHVEEDSLVTSAPAWTVGDMELLSDKENTDDDLSDDGQIDEFPGIDTGSESEGYSGNDSIEEEDEEDTDDSDTSELGIFPQARAITSVITGQPKVVYPDIEPEYDSDSSTEDVSRPHLCRPAPRDLTSRVFRLLTALGMFRCIGTTTFLI